MDSLALAQLHREQLSVSSTSTSSSYKGVDVSWLPSGTATLAGDLFSINIGASGSAANLFAIYDNGQAVFKVSENQIESAVPHTFTAAGDVSIAYDLAFTNQTLANIQSYGPLTIEAGEAFENNDLTLRTFGSGDVVAELGDSGQFKIVTADPTIVFDTTTATDTDYYMGVMEDAGGDDDDIFIIGDGTTFGSNIALAINTNGNVGIGSTAVTTGMTLDVAGNIRAGTELFMGSIGLNDTGNDRTNSGASVIGVNHEFSSNVAVGSTNVQDVLDDLDAAISAISSGTSVAWTDAGVYLYPTGGEFLGNTAPGGANKLAGIYLGETSPIYFGTDNDFKFAFDGTNLTLGDSSSNIFLSVGDSGTTGNFNFNNNQMYLRGDGFLGLGTTAPGAQFAISSTSTSSTYKGFVKLDTSGTATGRRFIQH
jgi:hypothetical protein